MKILLVSRILPHHSMGGMQEIAWDLAKFFAKTGNQVRILTTDIKNRDFKFWDNGIEIINLKETKPGVYSRDWWIQSRGYYLNHLKHNVDVIVSISSAALEIAKVEREIPTILQLHGTSFGEIISKFSSFNIYEWIKSVKNFYWLFKENFNYKNYAKVVCPGEKVFGELKYAFKLGFLEENKCQIIYNGIDQLLFNNNEEKSALLEKISISTNSSILVSASRLHSQKGLRNSLMAFAKLLKKHPNCYYIICGDGPDYSNLVKMCNDLKISNMVYFLGRVDRNELAKLLPHCSAFIFSTLRTEGLPLNCLEAIACGIPVVLSNHLLDLKGINGVHLINPKSPDEIYEKIESLITPKENSDGQQIQLPAKFWQETYFEQYSLLCSELHVKNLK